jgi:hypothetical protein
MSIASHKTFRLSLAAAVTSLIALGGAGLALSDSDEHDHHEASEHDRNWFEPGEDVAPVTNTTYAEECGACHMAYQPGLLPAAAWEQVMTPGALDDHYGDIASLPDGLRREITDYLARNGADSARRSRSRAFAVGDAGTDGLPRITETRYFRNEHHELGSRLVAENPDVGSFSNCNACHQTAGEGVYDEDQVRIPGHGRWED